LKREKKGDLVDERISFCVVEKKNIIKNREPNYLPAHHLYLVSESIRERFFLNALTEESLDNRGDCRVCARKKFREERVKR